jgi:predicted RNA-binding protein with PUA-like domain
MPVGDQVFYYHSSCDEPGIVGIAEVSKLAYPDETQFDRKSDYYDAESTRADPRWLNVDIRFVRKIGPVSLPELRKHKELAGMRILQRGNRLSVTPVDPAEWKYILRLAEKGGSSR